MIGDEKALPSLVSEIKKTEDIHVCLELERTIREIGRHNLEFLIKSLKSRNSRVRRAIVNVLGHLADKKAIPSYTVGQNM